jgi:glycosyltransferase involved in cell wall biosynthesis
MTGLGLARTLTRQVRRRWRERHLVTVCVPAYNAAGFIAETLQSIAVQTYRNIRVLISLDPSTDDTERVCQPFLADPRFTLTRQPTRLGWPGNPNYLLDQVRSDYFCLICHDDLIEPDYIARLMRRLHKAPAAVCAFPFFKRFGGDVSETRITSLVGERYRRAQGFFEQPLHAVPLRGVTRTAALRQGLRLHELGTGGFFAEGLYVFELALLGDCVRSSRTFYHSRYRPDSVSRGWRAWNDERKRAAWRALLQEFRAVVKRHFSDGEQIALLDAMLPWAYQLSIWLPASKAERQAIVDPERRAALARSWAADPEGKPPFL